MYALSGRDKKPGGGAEKVEGIVMGSLTCDCAHAQRNVLRTTRQDHQCIAAHMKFPFNVVCSGGLAEPIGNLGARWSRVGDSNIDVGKIARSKQRLLYILVLIDISLFERREMEDPGDVVREVVLQKCNPRHRVNWTLPLLVALFVSGGAPRRTEQPKRDEGNEYDAKNLKPPLAHASVDLSNVCSKARPHHISNSPSPLPLSPSDGEREKRPRSLLTQGSSFLATAGLICETRFGVFKMAGDRKPGGGAEKVEGL